MKIPVKKLQYGELNMENDKKLEVKKVRSIAEKYEIPDRRKYNDSGD